MRALIFMILFLLYGLVCNLKNNHGRLYLQVLIFLVLKMIFNMKVCIFAAIECKLRRVPEEKGVINQMLFPIVDLRKTKYIYLIVIVALFILLKNIDNIIKIPVKN